MQRPVPKFGLLLTDSTSRKTIIASFGVLCVLQFTFSHTHAARRLFQIHLYTITWEVARLGMF